METALLELAAQHGFNAVLVLVLLYELRDIRKARREERTGWREALDNNTEALRRLANQQSLRADGGDDHS